MLFIWLKIKINYISVGVNIYNIIIFVLFDGYMCLFLCDDESQYNNNYSSIHVHIQQNALILLFICS